jgi:hypothetical protein
MMQTATLHPSLRNVLCEAYDVAHVCDHTPVATYRAPYQRVQMLMEMIPPGRFDKLPFRVNLNCPMGNPFRPEVIFVCAEAKKAILRDNPPIERSAFGSLDGPRNCTACGLRYIWHDGECGYESHESLCEECDEHHGDVR